jgi:hypothetical protein
MANSIKVSSKLERLRGSVAVQSPPLTQVTVATTSELATDNVQIVGTTHELVDAGDVTDDAYMEVENLHATALVQIGGDDGGSFVPWCDIPAGYPPARFPIVASLAATYLQSSVAATPVRVTLVKIAS